MNKIGARALGAGLAALLLTSAGAAVPAVSMPPAEAASAAPADQTSAYQQGTVYAFDSAYQRTIAYDAGHSFRLDRDGRVILSYNRGKSTAVAPLRLSPPGSGAEERQSDQVGFYISPQLTAIAYRSPAGSGGEGPAEALISTDAGASWSTSVITAKTYGSPRFIGFRSSREGWAVLTAFAGMGHEQHEVYLTSDGGRTWRNASGNADDVYGRVMTGAGFVSRTTGFLSFRYEFADFQPAILQTRDGGRTWSKLRVKLPAGLSAYGLTPLSPVFFGAEGRYPVLISSEGASDIVGTLMLVSHNYGATWSCDPSAVRWNGPGPGGRG